MDSKLEYPLYGKNPVTYLNFHTLPLRFDSSRYKEVLWNASVLIKALFVSIFLTTNILILVYLEYLLTFH